MQRRIVGTQSCHSFLSSSSALITQVNPPRHTSREGRLGWRAWPHRNTEDSVLPRIKSMEKEKQGIENKKGQGRDLPISRAPRNPNAGPSVLTVSKYPQVGGLGFASLSPCIPVPVCMYMYNDMKSHWDGKHQGWTCLYPSDDRRRDSMNGFCISRYPFMCHYTHVSAGMREYQDTIQ